MENQENRLSCDCSFESVRPIIMALPYPEIRVAEQNREYANILFHD